MKKLWKGNHAIVEGAIAAGVDAYFGYPITPQNEITEYMSVRMREEKRIFMQPESELASINLALGVALTGKRAMTSSSSPGISLMQEGISYLAAQELPAVIVNIQRGGPGLGNISGAQSDYFQATKGGGHGDYHLFVLTPFSVQELFDMTKKAFKIAFQYRTPVMLLADGILGQMVEPAEINKVSLEKKEVEDFGWNLTGAANREARLIRSCMLGGQLLEKHNYYLEKKYQAFEKELDYEECDVEKAKIILVGYGTSARIILDAYNEAKDLGLPVGYFRLKTVYPFPSKRLYELSKHASFLVIEMCLGQMVEDVERAVQNKAKVSFYGRPAGEIPDVSVILKKIKELL